MIERSLTERLINLKLKSRCRSLGNGLVVCRRAFHSADGEIPPKIFQRYSGAIYQLDLSGATKLSRWAFHVDLHPDRHYLPESTWFDVDKLLAHMGDKESLIFRMPISTKA